MRPRPRFFAVDQWRGAYRRFPEGAAEPRESASAEQGLLGIDRPSQARMRSRGR